MLLSTETDLSYSLFSSESFMSAGTYKHKSFTFISFYRVRVVFTSALDYYHDESLLCLQTPASCNLVKKSAV